MMVQITPILAIGDPFPQLLLRNSAGAIVEFRPVSAVVIFYRGHWCDHCCAQLVSLADAIDAFRLLANKLYAISADDEAGAQAMHLLIGEEIAVLVDDDASAIEQLGLNEFDEESGRVVARPSAFIVDANGIVRYRYIGSTFQDRPKPALLLLGAESARLAR